MAEEIAAANICAEGSAAIRPPERRRIFESNLVGAKPFRVCWCFVKVVQDSEGDLTLLGSNSVWNFRAVLTAMSC